jgi:hypothetical protein
MMDTKSEYTLNSLTPEIWICTPNKKHQPAEIMVQMKDNFTG